ncbi:MAG: phenylalanine--tRNA ligase subunit beta, partial [Planctomycetota bacterium]
MLFSVEWLNDFVDLGDLAPREVGELFTTHVAAVDEVREAGGGWPGVRVGGVLDVRAHPNADKLRLVRVDYGDGEAEVVCGAPNVAKGQKICFAPEGTTLADGTVLKRRKIRGVESGGMVLSERELGLSDEHEGILVLDAALKVGTPARDVLPGGAVLDVDNTAITTRPDLWGHYGAARELAAVMERELRPPDLGNVRAELAEDSEAGVRVTVDAPHLCPRYLGWVLGGIEVGPSPDWLRRRLELAGQRSINNIVDLTNYILLEYGQPLHAFDRRQIADGHIIVREAFPGEKVVTLDGVERRLPIEGTCVIADPERPVAIAGVMGLQNSEVQDDTTEIILEVANFDMASIRRTSQELGLRTESAVRFEKGLDPEGVPDAAVRFVKLLKDVCPGVHWVGGPCDVRQPPPAPRCITVPPRWLARRLGTELSDERAQCILLRLGFGVERGEDASLQITVPSWRAGRDVSRPEDIAEEVGRIHGYDKIEPKPLRGNLEPVPEEPQRVARRQARQTLSDACGLTEIFLYPFTTAEACHRATVEPGAVAIATTPEHPGRDLLVPSLVPGVLQAVGHNLKYRDNVALYVIGPCFHPGPKGELPLQGERVAFAVATPGDAAPALDARGIVEALLETFHLRGVRVEQKQGPGWLHPGRSAEVSRGKEKFGWFGEVHPRVAAAHGIGAAAAVGELDFDALRGAKRSGVRMQPVPRFPSVRFDVAVVAD